MAGTWKVCLFSLTQTTPCCGFPGRLKGCRRTARPHTPARLKGAYCLQEAVTSFVSHSQRIGGSWTEDLAGIPSQQDSGSQLLLAGGRGGDKHQLIVKSSNPSEWSQVGLQERPPSLLTADGSDFGESPACRMIAPVGPCWDQTQSLAPHLPPLPHCSPPPFKTRPASPFAAVGYGDNSIPALCPPTPSSLSSVHPAP